MTSTPWSGRAEECYEQFASERNEAIRTELIGHVETEPVMDVGCGTGEFRKHVERAGGEYIGVDVTPEFEPDVVADATDLPFPNDHVPSVVCKNLLQHVPLWQAAVKECCRVASDRVVAVERTHDEDTQIVSDEPCLRRRFHPADLMDVFARHATVGIFDCKVDDRLSIVVGDV